MRATAVCPLTLVSHRCSFCVGAHVTAAAAATAAAACLGQVGRR